MAKCSWTCWGSCSVPATSPGAAGCPRPALGSGEHRGLRPALGSAVMPSPCHKAGDGELGEGPKGMQSTQQLTRLQLWMCPSCSIQIGQSKGWVWGLTRNRAGTSPPNPCPSPRAPPRALSFQGNSSGVIAKSSGASSAGCNVINLPARSWQKSNHGCFSKTEPGDN